MSIVFAASSFLIAYVVEDALFQRDLTDEVARQRARWKASGVLASPARDYVSVHRSRATFPDDLQTGYRVPGTGNEYAGTEGRHYHVTAFTVGDGTEVFLVAEVGDRLVVRARRWILLAVLGAVTAAFLTAAAGIGYWLADRATAPLRRLADNVSRVPSGEVPRISATEYPDDEVGALARALEALLDRTKGLVDREIAFTRDASHELRTPLAVIRSSAELIETRGASSVELAKPIRRMVSAAVQMQRTVELLLLLAREERPRPAFVPTILLPLVESAIVEATEHFLAARYRVLVDMPADTITLMEPIFVHTILTNLIGNAFRHAGGETLRIGIDDRHLVIADDGRGLPETVLTFLSDPAERSVGNGGLGLSIVKRLCQANHTSFAAESLAGYGTSFRLGIVQAMRGDDD